MENLNQLSIICENLKRVVEDLEDFVQKSTGKVDSILREDLLDELIKLDDRIRDDIYILEDDYKHSFDQKDDLNLIREEREKAIEPENRRKELEDKISRLMDIREKLKPIQSDLYQEIINSEQTLERLRIINKEYMLRPYLSKTLEDVL